MRTVDFDAIRAETQPGEPVEVVAGNVKFLVRPELPWLAVEAWDRVDTDAALAAVLVDPEQVPAFRDLLFADGVSRSKALDRLVAIWNAPGESQASSRSSANGSRRSKQTSRRTTNST